MRNTKRCLILVCSVLFILGTYSTVLAENGISIIDHSIKAVATVSSGRFIKIAWQVKLKNETNAPLTQLITVSFLDGNKENLGNASKTSKLAAGELTTITDTVVLPTAVAKRIATGLVKTTNADAT